MGVLSAIFEIASWEWLLTRLQLANGGLVIAIRAFFISLFVYSLFLVVINVVDPGRGWEFSLVELRVQLVSTIYAFGALFAGVYAALYARFAAQWSYLAGLYNQIKQVEAAGGLDGRVVSEWKAGFIEDADQLHLAGKPLFASIIFYWGNQYAVEEAFAETVPGGKNALADIMRRATVVWERERKKWGHARHA